MSFETGGRADKLGNRYEGRWVAKQLLRLLNEEIVSVTIEAIGDDEYGVDLWIVHKDGSRQAQQCKSRNKSKEAWSISDFKTRDILNKFHYQLDRNPQIEFKFVSGVPFINLEDICDSARNSSQDPEQFYKHQIVSASRKEIFRQFCAGMKLNSATSDDIKKAFDYLRRLRIDCFLGNETAWIDLKTQAGLLITGAPEVIISTLLTYAENSDSLGNPIYADDLWTYLKQQSLFPKNLAYDDRIVPCIERLREEFTESIQPGLIAGELIPREEADNCLQMLQDEKGLIILHGSAGLGKSGVLFEMVNKLHTNGIPYLPLRLDRRIPEKNAAQYGIDVGLPDTPVNCLIAVAGSRPCVLILDQLDAIRWTSAHSANSLDVCREVINQVLAFRREGKKISVIVACRTFDLKHDPEIKQWIESENIHEKWEQIEICPLSPTIVRQIIGEEYTSLAERQTKILAVPQNLAMWVHLHQEGRFIAFKSNIELMKMFWESKRAALFKVANTNDINAVFYVLAQWMETNGKICAPVLILSQCSSHAVKAIKSHDIIQEQNRTISFCHQSYLDYLIAEKLILEIFNGGNILLWLGPEEKQTLFRREQFRQALSWLADEGPEHFYSVVKEVLSAPHIRFHMKHLVLEIIGQLEDISNQLADYLLELSKNDYWNRHILTTVFSGSKTWISLLIDKDEISSALGSGEMVRYQDALNLLSSVIHKIPDKVSLILAPLVEKNGNWPNLVLNTIGWDVAKESDAIFELRLRLAQKGIFSDLIDWKKLSEKYPVRGFQLFAVILLWLSNRGKQPNNQRSKRVEKFYDHDFDALLAAAALCPMEVWDLLIPIVEQMTISWPESEYDPEATRWQKDDLDYHYTNIERVSVDSLIKAGQVLAQDTPKLLLRRTQQIDSSSSPVLQEILIETYSRLPPQYAEHGIQWLINDKTRLRLGPGYTEPEWLPAFRLIEALSPYCSQELFAQLENELVHYHDPNELHLAQYHLENWRRYGVWGDYWGRTQYFLLPALCEARRLKSSSELIEVLKRKFKGYDEESFLRSGRVKGGLVGSALNENLARISNRTWINIITDKTVPIEDRGNWKQYFDDHVIENSITQFSCSLRHIAASFPERFAQLALQLPLDTNYRYIAAIFSSLAATKANDQVLPDVRNNWEPATINTVIDVVSRYRHYLRNEVAIEFCRLIEGRSAELWPDFVLDEVAYLAKQETKLSRQNNSQKDTPHDLLNSSLNCVRGVACNAIASLLWKQPNLFSRFKPIIDQLTKADDPVVLVATMRILVPILNIDKKQAVTWFINAASKDIRGPASHYGSRFIGYTVREFADELLSTIKRMLYDQNQKIATLGSHMVSAFNLFYGIYVEEVKPCFEGPASHRIGIAKTAAFNIDNKKYAEKCREYITVLMDDSDKEVRSALHGMFREEIFCLPENITFMDKYVESKAFADESYGLFHSLESYKESLLPFANVILSACIAIVNNCRREGIANSGQMVYGLSPLLLRLYEQAQERDPRIANLCLNAWDVLFEHRIGDVRDLTSRIEQ